MLECPSCQKALPPSAHFCTRCGARLLATTTVVPDEWDDTTIIQPIRDLRPALALDAVHQQVASAEQEFLSDEKSAVEVETEKWPVQQIRSDSGSLASTDVTVDTPASVASVVLDDVHEVAQVITAPYEEKKRLLASQARMLATAMQSLLPFVYENHRAENQALFAETLEPGLGLEDLIWGRVAFVLGAYGNYMYRYPLSAEQKHQVWLALLWAVYYERCYRRKYLAQRCQQLLHFFQGCMEDSAFLAYALLDIEELYVYLEIGSLKKLEETLLQMTVPPVGLLQLISQRLVLLQEAKQALLAQQESASKSKTPLASKKGARTNQVTGLSSSQQSQSEHDFAQELKTADERETVASLPSVITGQVQMPKSIGQVHSQETIVLATRKLLSFFSDAQCQEFFVSLRLARLEVINQLLQRVRLSLLRALRHELSTAEMRVYQEPRRPIRLGKRPADRFVEARRLLHSARPHEQQSGLRLFEQGAKETTHPDYAFLAREWLLYARALVQGGHRVINEWESDLQREQASWEEIWNLAAFYQQTGYAIEVLRVLGPGLAAWSAPVAHLRFALTSALDLLLEPGRTSPAVQQQGQAFLLSYLEHWPHPLCCLVWLVLAHEAHGPLHPLQQSQRLSAFQELIEHPVTLPDPQKELAEAKISALEEDLCTKAGCNEAWFLWIHDYAEHHPRKYQAWTRLADASERLKRLASAEHALQHLVEIQYHHDYAHYQEGAPLPRAEYLRRNLEKLFEFYQRHNMSNYAAESFHSCYPSLSHLWNQHDPANSKLIALTRPYWESLHQQQEPAVPPKREGITRELGKTVTLPLNRQIEKKVGIFIDYENIARFIPREMDIEAVGQALVNYGAQFGTVVCQWASASPHNLSNLARSRLGCFGAINLIAVMQLSLRSLPSRLPDLFLVR